MSDDRTRHIADAVVAWAADEFGGAPAVVGDVASNGDGFDSEVYFLTLAGPALPLEWQRPLVVRVKPTVDALDVARHESDVQNWLADRGYATPRVLRVFEPGELLDRPSQIMERAAGTMLLDAVRRRPWQARSLIGRLAAKHVELHQLDPTGFPAGGDLLDKRLGLTRQTVETSGDEQLAAALEATEHHAGDLRGADAVVCHGDFHPLNALVDGDSMSIIDWTDAGVGDPHGDVARTLVLMDIAHIAASNEVERRVLRIVGPRLGSTYRRAYERNGQLDPRRLALWRPVHLLHGWSQVVALHRGEFSDGGEHPSADRVPASLIDELSARFDTELAALG